MEKLKTTGHKLPCGGTAVVVLVGAPWALVGLGIYLAQALEQRGIEGVWSIPICLFLAGGIISILIRGQQR